MFLSIRYPFGQLIKQKSTSLCRSLDKTINICRPLVGICIAIKKQVLSLNIVLLELTVRCEFLHRVRPHCDFEMKNSSQSAAPLLWIYLYIWDYCVMNNNTTSPFFYYYFVSIKVFFLGITVMKDVICNENKNYCPVEETEQIVIISMFY